MVICLWKEPNPFLQIGWGKESFRMVVFVWVEAGWESNLSFNSLIDMSLFAGRGNNCFVLGLGLRMWTEPWSLEVSCGLSISKRRHLLRLQNGPNVHALWRLPPASNWKCRLIGMQVNWDATLYKYVIITSNGQQGHSVSGCGDIQTLEIETCPFCGLEFSFFVGITLNKTAPSSFRKKNAITVLF